MAQFSLKPVKDKEGVVAHIRGIKKYGEFSIPVSEEPITLLSVNEDNYPAEVVVMLSDGSVINVAENATVDSLTDTETLPTDKVPTDEVPTDEVPTDEVPTDEDKQAPAPRDTRAVKSVVASRRSQVNVPNSHSSKGVVQLRRNAGSRSKNEVYKRRAK